MRMTQNKRAVLGELPSGIDGEPLSASAVALRLDKRMSDVARTLRHLEIQGCVVSERREHLVNRPKMGTYARNLKCYRLAPDFNFSAERP